jgi:3',5'-cyclic AMP phosphodiesterase CpdA
MGAAGRALLLLAALAGCFEYSPHQLPDDPDERDLNRKAVERIVSRPVERLRFAVVGDAQRAFSEADDLGAALRARGDVQFVVQIGDFTNLGLWLEYRLMNELFAAMGVPYLVVVGNHDLLGNGGAIYDAMFGPRSFAFTHARVRFVCFDSNSVAYAGGVPDPVWLAAQLAPAAGHDRGLAFSHVAPGQGADFDEALTAPTIAALAAGAVDASFHGHAHHHAVYERGGVRFVITDSLEHRSYLVVSQRQDGGFDVERVGF